MSRSFTLLLSLAAMSGSAALAQSNGPAPIQRGYSQNAARPNVQQVEVVEGIVVRSAPGASVETLQADADRTEIRISHGLANVSVHHPEHHGQILVDLPGGQTAILDDGLYTFNAATNTVRVYKGEAEAFGPDDRSVKVSDSHYVTFNGGELHAIPGNNLTARTDVLPGVYADSDRGYDRNHGDGYRAYGAPAYGYGAGYYGGGYPYSPYPYYGFGGSPYGYYGYPYSGFSIGLGFGYGGYGRGYYGGGYRGGYGYRGFRR